MEHEPHDTGIEYVEALGLSICVARTLVACIALGPDRNGKIAPAVQARSGVDIARYWGHRRGRRSIGSRPSCFRPAFAAVDPTTPNWLVEGNGVDQRTHASSRSQSLNVRSLSDGTRFRWLSECLPDPRRFDYVYYSFESESECFAGILSKTASTCWSGWYWTS